MDSSTGETALVLRGAGAGTLAYKAPEAFEDKFTTASEVYSFGVVAWEVLTGAVPWEGYTEARLTRAMIITEERPPLGADVAATDPMPIPPLCTGSRMRLRMMSAPPWSALMVSAASATRFSTLGGAGRDKHYDEGRKEKRTRGTKTNTKTAARLGAPAARKKS